MGMVAGHSLRGWVQRIWVPLLVVAICALLPTLGLVSLTLGAAAAWRIRTSYFQRLFVTLLLVLAANTLCYQVFNLLGIHPNIALIGSLYGLFGLWLFMQRNGNKAFRPLITKADVACLTVGIITFIALFYPVVLNRSVQQSYAESTFHLLVSGEDNASHFAMFKYVYAHDGYAYMTDPEHNGLIIGLTNYPQGSEFTMAWITKGILGENSYHNNRMLIKAYYVFCALQFALLMMSILLVAAKLYEKTGKRLGLAGGAAIVVIGICLAAAGPYIELMSRGFHSQIAAYLFLMGMLYILLQQKETGSFKKTFFAAVVLFGGICTSWWFLAPVALFPLALYAYINWKHVRTSRWPFFVWTVILGLLSAYTLLLSLLSVKTSGVNDDGGVDVIAPTSIALYLVGYALIFLLPKTEWRRFNPLTATLIGFILFTAAVGIYQYAHIGHFAYYYYKSLFTLIPISLVAVTYITLVVIQKASRSFSRLQHIWLGVSIIVMAFCAMVALKPVYTIVYLHDWYNNPITTAQIQSLYKHASSGIYKDMIFVGNCSNGINYISNRWSGAFFLSESPWRSSISSAAYRGDIGQTVKLLKHSPGETKDIFIHATTDCLDPKLEQTIRDRGFATDLPPLPHES